MHLEYCHTSFQAADIFTKALPPNKWERALQLLGMVTTQPTTSTTTSTTTSSATTTTTTTQQEDAPPPLVDEGDNNFETPLFGYAADGQQGGDQSEAEVEGFAVSQYCELPATCSSGLDGVMQTLGDLHSDLMEVDYSDEKCSSVLKQFTDSCKAALALPATRRTVRPSPKPPCWGQLIELCTHPDSSLGRVAKDHYSQVQVHRICKDKDLSWRSTGEQLKEAIIDAPGSSLHASLPCTVWSSWQNMSIHTQGKAYHRRLKTRQRHAVRLLRHFIELAEVVLAGGGQVSFEWPRHCPGWQRQELIDFIHRHQLYSVSVDGCECGLTNSDGDPVLKKWRFVTSSQRQAESLSGLRCQHPPGFRHAEISGSTTKATERYPDKLCHTMLSGLFGHWDVCPAMPCVEVVDYGHIRPGEVSGFGATPCSSPVGISILQ